MRQAATGWTGGREAGSDRLDRREAGSDRLDWREAGSDRLDRSEAATRLHNETRKHSESANLRQGENACKY